MGVHVAPHPHHVVGDRDMGPIRSVVASCYSFNVHFPYDEWRETSIHLLTFHFHSFSPEMTVQVLGPFLSKVVSFLILEFYHLFFFFFVCFGEQSCIRCIFCKYFLLLCGWSSHPPTLYFRDQSVFMLMKSIISFTDRAFDVVSKVIIIPKVIYDFSYGILQKLYSFAFYTILSLS